MKKTATMLSKKDVISMLCHDLKDPMMAIHSYADILLDKLPDIDGEGKEMLERIKSSVMKYSRLLDDFITLSRYEAGKLYLNLKPASLSEVAAFCADDLEVLAREKYIIIHKELPCDLPDVAIDERQCGRVISNVLANAIKYSDEGGRVWVRAGVDDGRSGKVYLEVSDEGPGISEEDLPHIMETYYRSDPTGKAEGTGLGLAIVKALTELHGGDVEIKNKPDKGALVRISLPAAAATSPSTQ